MWTPSQSAFVLIRHPADLERESAGLTAYLSHRRRRSATGGDDTLQGIWIDENGVANLPGALALSDGAGGRRIVRVTEAAGVNGIWMVCWLDTTAASVSRVDLLEALLECSGQDESSVACPGRFVPVFSFDAPEVGVKAELHQLRVRYPAIVLAPILQDGSGRLIVPVGGRLRERC